MIKALGGTKMQDYDVVVIGGGIVGTAVARELSKYKIKTALLESKLDVGAGTTKGNGGVVHAGYITIKCRNDGCARYSE